MYSGTKPRYWKLQRLLWEIKEDLKIKKKATEKVEENKEEKKKDTNKNNKL